MKRVPKLIKMTVIASRQRRGDVTKVAEATGYSVSYVSRVIRGVRNNEFILSTAYRMTRRRIKNSELA
jgi:DNA-binding IscR family transcriptional regulator